LISIVTEARQRSAHSKVIAAGAPGGGSGHTQYRWLATRLLQLGILKPLLDADVIPQQGSV